MNIFYRISEIKLRTMKAYKLFIFIILPFLLISNNSYSQLKYFGIKGGLNLSNAELDYTGFNYQHDNKTGFNAYLTYDLFRFNNLNLSGEAGYSQKGFDDELILTDEFGNEYGRATLYYRLNYIEINAIAEFIFRCKSVSPYFSVGPVLSFYTGYNSGSSDDRIDSLIQSYEDPLFENLKTSVIGIVAGAGAEINKVIPQTIIAEVRYNFDLTNSFNNGFLNYQRNYLWQFNLGVKF